MKENYVTKALLILLNFGLISATALAQHQVSGIVTDEHGDQLPGVNIYVKGTTIGTATDVDGLYRLTTPVQNDTLVFSFIGYNSQEVPIQSRTTINVSLRPVLIFGDEVVVVGYGTMRQRDLTGSFSTVQADQLNTVARSSVNQMLVGMVPGLNMQMVGAQPGSRVSVNMRGAISAGGNTPLYVIDGVPMTRYDTSIMAIEDSDLGFSGGIDRDPLAYLNPSDIESITVMRDASAAAIYGSAASNGVILITTKRGRSGDIQVEYRGSYSVQTPKNYFPLLNERQFMTEQRRLSYDWYLYEQNIFPYGTNTSSSVDYNPMYSDAQIAAAGSGTNWFDQVSRTGSIQEHNITMSGGSEATRLYGSFSIHDNQAILRNSDYSRYTGRINLDQTLSTRIQFRLRMNVSQQASNNVSTGASHGGPALSNLVQSVVAYSPTIPVYEDDGVTYSLHYDGQIMNPVSYQDIRDDLVTNNLFVAPTLDIEVLDNLRLSFTGQYDRAGTVRNFYLPKSSRHAFLPEGMAQKSEQNRINSAGETYATYSQRFDDVHNLSVMAGAGIYSMGLSGFRVEANGFFTDAFRDDNLAIAHNLLSTRMMSFRQESLKLSQFARVNYSYKDRYILTLVGRRDGSSVFAEDQKWGFFPGISAAWMISEETFMKNIDALTELKLRVGYGQAGNEGGLAGNTLQLYEPTLDRDRFQIGGTLYGGVRLMQIANPRLSWETVETINLGLDFGLYRNRIRGSLDVYQRSSIDRISSNPLPYRAPVGSVIDNVGSTESYGVELTLNTLNLSNRSVLWRSDFSISWQEARWVERNPRVPLNPWVGERDLMGTIYGVRAGGIYRPGDPIPDHMSNIRPGNLIFVDTNGDGALNNDDIIIIGNSIPKWHIGLRNEVNYRSFSLSVYAYGRLKYDRWDTYSPLTDALRIHGVPRNTTTYVSEAWSHDNPDGWRPGVAPNPHSGDFATGSDFGLYDASFIRIQDITLGYNLPPNVLAILGGISSARLFLTVQNLGVITNYPGYDPEYTEPNPYPHNYTTTMSVDIRF